MSSETILILGGSGKTGRRVVGRLTAKGKQVRLASRSTVPAFDWTDPSGWTAVLEGVDAAYVSYQPDLSVPGAVEAIGTLCRLAAEKGVKHLVLLSGRGEDEALAAEETLKHSGVAYTIIRASWFFQNFSETFFLEGIQSGELVLPVGNVKEPFIDADDIADIAVAALTEPGHAGKTYEVTGPRLLTFGDAVAEIARQTGRDIRFTTVDIGDYVAMLEQEQIPADYIWLIRYLFTSVLDGRNETTTDGVAQALGRPPRDFADYVRETAATGVWEDLK
ncbi:NAD(P)H-binding protein [Pararhizobium sp. YC-54]|uniref:NAD(P)H-binding protein n=1 Tax=Pararhizobium sp. YC-54 TaxID=2986920 RepID=UPI0021F78089|nr:NAD(P)H-binding protein [Pararhizobium sp. YC-54]MCW0000951.1 NAD(P)H-binding protein [Pararhizobium sp. YC-54]